MNSLKKCHWVLLTILTILYLPLAMSGPATSHCKALNGSTLKAVGQPVKPFLNNDEVHIGLPSGMDMDILKIVAKKLSFSFSFQPTKAGGSKCSNGTWIGTVAKVKSGIADIGIGPLSINVDRNEVIRFTTPVYFLNYFFLTRKPIRLNQHFRVIEPFPPKMWLLIFLAFLLITMALWILSKIQDKPVLISKLALEVLGLMLAHGYQQCFREKLSKKKWAAFTLLCVIFSAFIVHFYNCTLLKSLMTEQYEKPINNAEDLVKNNRPLYIYFGGHQESLFRDSQNANFQRLYEETLRNQGFYATTNGGFPPSILAKIKHEGGAILADEFVLKTYIQKMTEQLGHDPFRIGNENIVSVTRGFMVQKSSGLEECFDPILRYLHDSGIILKIIDQSASPKNVNKRMEEDEKIPIRMEHLSFAFVLLIAGILMASITFLLELRAHKGCCKRLNRSKLSAPERRPRGPRTFLVEIQPSAKSGSPE